MFSGIGKSQISPGNVYVAGFVAEHDTIYKNRKCFIASVNSWHPGHSIQQRSLANSNVSSLEIYFSHGNQTGSKPEQRSLSVLCNCSHMHLKYLFIPLRILPQLARFTETSLGIFCTLVKACILSSFFFLNAFRIGLYIIQVCFAVCFDRLHFLSRGL